jgi:hypothetical protein
MRNAAVASAILWSLAQAASSQPLPIPEEAWLQDGVKWAKAPRKINRKLSSGRAAIIYFGPDHAFSLIYATVNRVPREYEVICNGCGQAVYSGTWKIDAKTIRVKYRLVSRTIEVTGEQLPGPVREDTAKMEGAAVCSLDTHFIGQQRWTQVFVSSSLREPRSDVPPRNSTPGFRMIRAVVAVLVGPGSVDRALAAPAS